MTVLLAVECSTDACSVALASGAYRDERFVVQAREHHRLLLPMAQELLAQHNMTLPEVDAFALGVGPGSFTGLRLAVGVVQGLAYALQKPVIPVSSLAATALAYARERGLSSSVLQVAVDARMGDVYFGVYRQDGGHLRVLEADQLLPRGVLLERTDRDPAAHCIGNGWPSPVEAFPHASAVLELALPRYAAGQCVSPQEAQPVYLRDEVGWQKWQRKTAP